MFFLMSAFFHYALMIHQSGKHSQIIHSNHKMRKSKTASFFSFIVGSNVSKEEKIERKVKPKSHVSLKEVATGKNLSAKTTKTATAPKASQYFQSPVKEEEEYDSKDDFYVPTPAEPAISPKLETDGEDEDSDEDEGDWEEVEGLSTCGVFVRGELMMIKFMLPKYDSSHLGLVKTAVILICLSVD